MQLMEAIHARLFSKQKLAIQTHALSIAKWVPLVNGLLVVKHVEVVRAHEHVQSHVILLTVEEHVRHLLKPRIVIHNNALLIAKSVDGRDFQHAVPHAAEVHKHALELLLDLLHLAARHALLLLKHNHATLSHALLIAKLVIILLGQIVLQPVAAVHKHVVDLFSLLLQMVVLFVPQL